MNGWLGMLWLCVFYFWVELMVDEVCDEVYCDDDCGEYYEGVL